ncbi:MAG: hypothetical protein GXP06_00885 [Alphaproteobacteria bacterium]|nr:hypothetical protein [Alphaproteobacteria bacterium]
MMIDPQIHIAFRLLLAIIIGAALVHKIGDVKDFQRTLQSYKLLPNMLTALAAYVVMLVEALITTALLIGFSGAGFAAALLFAFYGALIGVKLAQGQIYIDCGCSWVKGARLSVHYCYRNGVLAALGLFLVLPVSGRAIGVIDYINIGGFAATAAGVYFLLDAVLHMKNLELAR